MLFLLRSFLVVIGLLGIYLALRNRGVRKKFLLIVLGYMITWYLYISFIYRNIEMRYLLHTDILLLIPAAFALTVLFFNKHLKATG